MEIISPLLGNIGTVILLILVWKSGLLKYLLEAKNGNGNGKNGNGLQNYINEEQKQFNQSMALHAQKANDEMGDVKKELAVINVKIDDGFKSLKEDIKDLRNGK